MDAYLFLMQRKISRIVIHFQCATIQSSSNNLKIWKMACNVKKNTSKKPKLFFHFLSFCLTNNWQAFLNKKNKHITFGTNSS